MPISQRTLAPSSTFTPRSISGLALWLDASQSGDLYTTDAGPVVPITNPAVDIAGCVGWYDASDAATLFDSQSGGSTVSTNGATIARWEDKSGGGRHLTQSTANTGLPTLSTNALAGRNVVAFGGTGTGAGFSMTNPVSRAAQTVFAVYRSDAQSDASACIITDDTSAYGAVVTRGAVTTLDCSFGNFTLGGGRIQFQLNASPTAVVGPAITSSVHASAPSVFQNGTSAGSGTSSSAVALSRVGYYNVGATNFRLKGYIAELVIYDSALSTTDRARVEAYLAAKWGIGGVHAPATAASDPVGYWRDRSGNNRHATQGTASYRGTVGSQGSRRAITLDGTDDHLLLGNLSAAFPTAGEVIVAYALNAVDTAYTVYQTSDNSNSDVFGSITFGGAFRNTRLAGLALVGPSAVGTHLWGVSSQSAGYNIWVEGSNALSTTADHTGGTNHAIGMRSATPGVNQAMNGKLLEVCGFNRVLSAPERQRLNRYLAQRWGITLAPQVSNADAQDWINRVYANGSTVSASTAAAVNTFCESINAVSGLREKFYRLNLFCGGAGSSDPTRLNACLVPLYRGPSPGGPQFGATTDANNGPFFSGDYTETGASGGLWYGGAVGGNTGKRLRTGLAQNTMPSGDLHLAAYEIAKSNASSDTSVGARTNAGASYSELLMSTSATDYGFSNFLNTFSRASDNAYTQPGAMMLGVASGATQTLYKNGSSVGSATAAQVPSFSSQFAVFATENESGSHADLSNARLGGYSIGLSMTPAQVAAYYTAMQAFQSALQRNV